MGDFISWTEKPYIDEKDGKEKKAVLFLTDKEVFETVKGAEMIKYMGEKSDLVGHGGIAYYYDMRIDSFPHLENTDLSGIKHFPEEIINAVRQGKLDRLMRYAHGSQWLQLLKPGANIDGIDKTNYDSCEFKPGIMPEEQDTILQGIDDMIKNPHCHFLRSVTSYWPHKKDIGNILARLRWTNSKEGFQYWNEVSKYSLVNTFSGSGFNYDQFLTLWKNQDNRLDCWKLPEEKPEKPKRKRAPKKKTGIFKLVKMRGQWELIET